MSNGVVREISQPQKTEIEERIEKLENILEKIVFIFEINGVKVK